MTMWKCASLGLVGMLLASCAGPHGTKGNDTGGIIPWSPDTERNALFLAQEQCDRYDKGARIRSMDRRYGGYIAYACVFDGPLRRRWGR